MKKAYILLIFAIYAAFKDSECGDPSSPQPQPPPHADVEIIPLTGPPHDHDNSNQRHSEAYKKPPARYGDRQQCATEYAQIRTAKIWPPVPAESWSEQLRLPNTNVPAYVLCANANFYAIQKKNTGNGDDDTGGELSAEAIAQNLHCLGASHKQIVKLVQKCAVNDAGREIEAEIRAFEFLVCLLETEPSLQDRLLVEYGLNTQQIALTKTYLWATLNQ